MGYPTILNGSNSQPPLPQGESVITITAQNAKGGVNTLQKKIVIQ